MAIIDKIQLSGTVYTIGNETTTAVTSASTDNEIPTAKAVYDAIPQGGGGKAISGGTNISITTGETADTINCTIPAFFHSNTVKGDINIGSNDGVNSDYGRLVIGRRVQSRGNPYFQYSIGIGVQPDDSNKYCQLYGQNSVGIGRGFKIGSDSLYSGNINNAIAIGHNATSRNDGDITLGANATASGNSSVAIGSGATADGAEYKMNLNNQIKVTPSNQVYIYNKDNTEMICLQDQLGGGSITIDPSLDSGSTNAVANSAITNALHEAYFYNIGKESDNKPQTKFILFQKYIDTKQNTSYSPSFIIAGINGKKIAAIGGNPDRTNFELVETSAITTSVTSSSTDSQVPSAKAVYDQLDGLKLKKITQSEYDALSPNYDANTLYVING